ncbi:hypothetical protein [Chryseobacterium sp. MYb328]|uniref:hypothetical protein n=1 Tax=Chryseobacterium sp. MYb328 TaxID=2745231 RepID=UPI003096508A
MEQSKVKPEPGVGPHWQQRKFGHPVGLYILTQLNVESYIIVPITDSPSFELIMFLQSALVGKPTPFIGGFFN